ncbi:MAG: hypothetical protein LUC38_08955 [Oscillospiraceae bacterium]|nr:hypothetical protein [Ruminococcus sp.]MCD8346059.1 hypothetical protein [Oscillospiraceae bacterium]
MKKFLAMFLSLLLVISIIPTAAFATGTVAGTTINGQLDISGLTDDDSGDGWSWDESAKTLTLTNLTITNEDNKYWSAIVLPSDEETVTVVLSGSNYISGFTKRVFAFKSDDYSVTYGSITLTGSGSLVISDCSYFQNGNIMYTTIDGTDGLTVTSTTENGFIAGYVCTINNGATFTSVAIGDDAWSAIYALEGVEISDSTVVASLTDYAYPAIYVTGSESITETYINITNSDVTVSTYGSTWGFYCAGTTSATTTITDSSITVDSAAGIYSASDIVLNGVVEVLAESNRQLMYTATIDSTGLRSGSDIQGYVRQGNEIFYLTDYTLESDFSVATGLTLTIPDGVTLTLANDVTLSSVDDGAIINNGTIVVPCGSSGGVASGALSSGSNAVEENHTYGNPVFTWSEDYTTATATFTCTACGDVQTVEAVVTSEVDGFRNTVYTATIAGTTYTDTQTVAAEPTTTTTSKSDIYTTLSRIQASYTAVQAAIEKANSLNPSDYENFSAVTEAIEAVDWSLNVLNQKTVNAYAEAIEEAIENLVPVSTTEEIVEIDEPVEAGETDIE